MSITAWARQFATAATDELPSSVFRYVLATSGVHQLLLLALTVSVFLIEIAPLELQRRIINDLVKNRPYRWGHYPVRGLCRCCVRPRRHQARPQCLSRLGRRARRTRPAPTHPWGHRGAADCVARSRSARNCCLDDRGSRTDRWLRWRERFGTAVAG